MIRYDTSFGLKKDLNLFTIEILKTRVTKFTLLSPFDTRGMK